MKLKGIQCRDLLSFADLTLEFGDLMVVTGPNGAGKSNLGRAVDLACAVIGNHGGHPAADRVSLYERAARFGAPEYEVVLRLELDQPAERELVTAFFRAAVTCALGEQQGRTEADWDGVVRDQVTEQTILPLLTGQLHVHYDAHTAQRWYAAWEFTHKGVDWHIDLVGRSPALRPGLAGAWWLPDEGIARPVDRWRQLPAVQAALGGRKVAPEPVELGELLPKNGGYSLTVQVPGQLRPIPTSVVDLARGLGIAPSEALNSSFDFTRVLAQLLQRAVVITDNRRLPLRRTFPLDTLGTVVDLRDGSGVPGELYRLKNGTLLERRRYEEAKKLFGELTGREFGLTAAPAGGELSIDVNVLEGPHEQPIALSGAGIQEALVLSALLTGEPGRVVVLDEPAVNLEPTVQRRLLRHLSDRPQCLVITHSADLVPVQEATDLDAIVRLAPHPGGTTVHRVPDDVSERERARWLQELGKSDVRALLFAAGAVLCEGPTEVRVLGNWWDGHAEEGWVGPSAANIALIDVGGHDGFGPYLNFVHAFGIPFAVVADGPALRRGSRLCTDLDGLGRLPDGQPDDGDDFAAWKTYWECGGVFTLANAFGDDGSKEAEIEVFLQAIDRGGYTEARRENGRSKPRAGAYFAARHAAPEQVLELYRRIRAHLTPRGPDLER